MVIIFTNLIIENKYDKKSELKNKVIFVTGGTGSFGWGAICWKDFEIFISGALLIKPDMSHIKTWPNYYIENETYVPYKWDASDLKSTIEQFYSNTDLSERIACAGQDKYKYYNVFNNPEPFLNRFQEIFN